MKKKSTDESFIYDAAQIAESCAEDICQHPMAEREFRDDQLWCRVCEQPMISEGYAKSTKGPVAELFGVAVAAKEVEKPEEIRQLNEAAQNDRDSFNADYDGGNCSCHISAPCGSCMHPGNPLNQDDDEFWELVDDSKVEMAEEMDAIAAESLPTSFVSRDPDKIGATFTHHLPVELPEHGKEQARLFQLWQRTQLDKKAFTKSCNSVIDQTEEQMIAIASIIMTGTEEKQVDCRWEFDYATGVKKLRRLDTWDVVEEKTLEGAELHLSFDFEKKSEENVAEFFGGREEVAADVEQYLAEIDQNIDAHAAEVPTLNPDCVACESAHPDCNGCCEKCTDPCNAKQFCRLESGPNEEETVTRLCPDCREKQPGEACPQWCADKLFPNIYPADAEPVTDKGWPELPGDLA